MHHLLMEKIQNIYIIDDNEIDILIHKKIIKDTDQFHNISTFNNAAKALKHLESIPNDQPFPELVFLDLHMPSINGFDFMVKYQQIDHPKKDQLKIIILSNSMEEHHLKVLNDQKNIMGFYNKPLDQYKIQDISAKIVQYNKKATQ